MITGVRQSRRLAALAEAPSHSLSDPHAAQQQATAPHQQGTALHQQGAAPHQQGRASHQQEAALHQQKKLPQQAAQPSATQSAALLQASTLEASANVLKGLVRVHNDWFRVYIGHTMTVCNAAQGLGDTIKALKLHHAALDPREMQSQNHILMCKGVRACCRSQDCIMHQA